MSSGGSLKTKAPSLSSTVSRNSQPPASSANLSSKMTSPSHSAARACQAGLASKKTASPAESNDFRIDASLWLVRKPGPAELLALRLRLGNRRMLVCTAARNYLARERLFWSRERDDRSEDDSPAQHKFRRSAARLRSGDAAAAVCRRDRQAVARLHRRRHHHYGFDGNRLRRGGPARDHHARTGLAAVRPCLSGRRPWLQRADDRRPEI